MPHDMPSHHMHPPLHHRLAVALGYFSLTLGAAELLAPRGMATLTGLPRDRRTLATLRQCGVREIAAGMAILAQPDRAGWLWSRVGGDLMDLSFLGSAARRDNARPARVAIAVAAVTTVTVLDLLVAQRLRHDNGHEENTSASPFVEGPIDQDGVGIDSGV
jgi:hypothetical protein